MGNKAFGEHTSERLLAAYRKKYWQGQNPNSAKMIFLGLDANWDIGIETNETGIFDEIIEYLEDGVTYWKKKGFHHPFMSPKYKKGGGYRYHSQFARADITNEFAEQISFVELLNKPTYGSSSHSAKLFNSMIKVEHLTILNDIIFNGEPKIVFIPKSVYDKINVIKAKNKLMELFKFGLELENGVSYLNRLMNIHNENNTFIFVHTHFSNAISKNHLKQIGLVAKTFNKKTERNWWKISYVSSWNGERVEESRFIFARDVLAVKRILCKYLNPYRVERDFIQLEFQTVMENEVDKDRVW